MLLAKDIFFSYKNQIALKGVSIEAAPKTIISLLGPNGSGKSTLLRCLAGLIKPQKGVITLSNMDIRKLRPKEIAKRISFLPQIHEPVRYITVWDLVARGRSPHVTTGWYYSLKDRQKIDWALDYMQLSHLKHRQLGAISGGERQRAWIAMALAQDTAIVLLDEPVTFLDIKHQWGLLEVINNLKEGFGKTIITVFHDINHALAISDIVYLLKQGNIYNYGLTEETITDKSLQHVYEINATVCRVNKCWYPVVVPIGNGIERQVTNI